VIESPAKAFSEIEQYQPVRDALLRYQNTDTEIKYGNLLTIPLGGGLLYVEPVYTQQKSETATPNLNFVVVRFGEHTAIATSLKAALDELFAGDAGAETSETPEVSDESETAGGGGATTAPLSRDEAVTQALEDAQAAVDEAQAALSAGDLGAYQEAIKKAQELLAAALEEMNG
jgi:uncharacterized membrane protein (UPF0182 family)